LARPPPPSPARRRTPRAFSAGLLSPRRKNQVGNLFSGGATDGRRSSCLGNARACTPAARPLLLLRLEIAQNGFWISRGLGGRARAKWAVRHTVN